MNNGNRNNGRMTPRERYFAEQKAAAERERIRQAEAAKLAAERERAAKLAAQKRIYAEKERRRKAAEKRRRQKEARILGQRFILFAVIFLIILAVALLCVAVSFWLTKVPPDAGAAPYSYKYTYIDDGEETASWKQNAEDSVRNGVLYVNFTKFADAVGFTLTGGGDERRFVTSEGAEEIALTVGTSVLSVNSFSYRMEADAVYSSESEILVPLSFLTECVVGVNVTLDEEKHTVALEKKGEVTFVLKPADIVPPVSEETDYGDTTEPSTDTETGDEPEPEVPIAEFVSDLSEYEMYMNPADRDAYLVLVNAWSKLDETYIPDDLIEVTNTRKDGRNAQKLRLYAAKSLEALFIELFACGYDDPGPTGYPVSVTSAYRSYSYQSQLFNQYVDREMKNDPTLTRAEAEAITETYSARPGTSEHQTGLCIDMHNLASAMRAFENEEAYEWLTENAWKFGFVLRFPDGKTNITGITFEPWHYRYVGRYHAYQMKTLGMCLEEYVEYLQ